MENNEGTAQNQDIIGSLPAGAAVEQTLDTKQSQGQSTHFGSSAFTTKGQNIMGQILMDIRYELAVHYGYVAPHPGAQPQPFMNTRLPPPNLERTSKQLQPKASITRL